MPTPGSISLLLAFALALLLPSPGTAQVEPVLRPGDVLIGTVEQQGQPVEGVPVALHRVTPQVSGEVATAVSDAEGGFRFTLEPDTSAAFTAYFVTAEHLSVRYFGPPLHSATAVPESYTVQVYDTTSVLPAPLRIPRRDIVMAALPDGSWEVNEMIQLVNPTSVALVPTAGMPTWEFRIPESASDFEAGEGGILPHEVARMEERVMLLTPMPPGSREMYVRYRLPARPTRSTVTIGEATDTLNLFVQQPSHLSEVDGLRTATMLTVEGETYLQYSGSDLPPGSSVALAWSGAWSSPVDPVAAAVAVTLLLLAIGAFAAIRNRPAAPIG